MVKLWKGIYEYSEQNDNNYSMSFDGNDDYIDIPDIPMGEQYTGEFSFSAYVYAGEETATDYFIIYLLMIIVLVISYNGVVKMII